MRFGVPCTCRIVDSQCAVWWLSVGGQQCMFVCLHEYVGTKERHFQWLQYLLAFLCIFYIYIMFYSEHILPENTWTSVFLMKNSTLDFQLVPMDMLMQLLGDLFPKLKVGSRIPALVVVGIVFFLSSLPTCTGVRRNFLLICN